MLAVLLALGVPAPVSGQTLAPSAEEGHAVPAPTAAPAAPSRGLFPTQPPPADRPGFVYEFGRWIEGARDKIDELRKQSNDAAQQAANATQDAVKNAARTTQNALRIPRVIEVNERCRLAPNGAPDCRTAATAVCRAKGFSSGHPIDVRSSANCPPAVWISGREPAPGECPEETVVLLAACN